MASIDSHVVALSKEGEEEVFRSGFAVAIALLGEGAPRPPRELVQLADSVVWGGADGVPSCCNLSTWISSQPGHRCRVIARWMMKHSEAKQGLLRMKLGDAEYETIDGLARC